MLKTKNLAKVFLLSILIAFSSCQKEEDTITQNQIIKPLDDFDFHLAVDYHTDSDISEIEAEDEVIEMKGPKYSLENNLYLPTDDGVRIGVLGLTHTAIRKSGTRAIRVLVKTKYKNFNGEIINGATSETTLTIPQVYYIERGRDAIHKLFNNAQLLCMVYKQYGVEILTMKSMSVSIIPGDTYHVDHSRNTSTAEFQFPNRRLTDLHPANTHKLTVNSLDYKNKSIGITASRSFSSATKFKVFCQATFGDQKSSHYIRLYTLTGTFPRGIAARKIFKLPALPATLTHPYTKKVLKLSNVAYKLSPNPSFDVDASFKSSNF